MGTIISTFFTGKVGLSEVQAGLLQGKGWAAEWQVVWACLSETPGAPQLS